MIENEILIINISEEICAVTYGTYTIVNWFEDKKLSNALAKTWLYLKKEGYIK